MESVWRYIGKVYQKYYGKYMRYGEIYRKKYMRKYESDIIYIWVETEGYIYLSTTANTVLCGKTIHL